MGNTRNSELYIKEKQNLCQDFKKEEYFLIINNGIVLISHYYTFYFRSYKLHIYSSFQL